MKTPPAWHGPLLRWYRRSRRRLPWREEPDPYKVWVSELMLQQTRVATVVPHFLRFVARFPDLASLAAASEQEVLARWSGLGYYRRARALHRAARILVEREGGRFPETVQGWLELPGVGRYTAGAIVSIAFGRRAPILDGNVARVLSRCFGIRGDPRSGSTRRALWRAAEEILPEESVAEFNQALMELGALVCTPRAPACLVCPLSTGCVARKQGLEEKLPELPVRPRSVPVSMAAAVVEDRRRLLVYRRSGVELMRDLWEFPTAECREEESPREAVAREARETYGIRLTPERELARVKHTIMNRRITLYAFSAALESKPRNRRNREHRWVTRSELGMLPISSMVQKIVDATESPEPGEKAPRSHD